MNVAQVNTDAPRHAPAGDPVVLTAHDAADARRRCDALPAGQPVVLLLDAGLDEATLQALAARRPLALLAPDAGARQMRAALEAVAAGLHVSAYRPLRNALPASNADALDEPLTPREIEVLELLGKGLTNADLGRTLRISSHTAKFHVARILSKLGAATRAEAVHAGLRRGVIGL